MSPVRMGIAEIVGWGRRAPAFSLDGDGARGPACND